MTDREHPQIYLISPPEIDLDTFPGSLARVLDTHEVACIRLALATRDEDRLRRVADACRDVAIARDVAIVMQDHRLLARQLGLDGVHLGDGARSVRAARKDLGPDAIVGCFCGTSRHDGLTAGEAGADYVSFGPVGTTSLGSGAHAERDQFEWWSEMIEVPVVAEGALTAEIVADLAGVTDFFGISEIWEEHDPSAELSRLLRAIG